jgi:hypothetical protein
MNSLSAAYLSRAETWMLITTLAYFTMNGAQLFETFVLIPRWTSRPPVSLQLFNFGLPLKAFWIWIHSLHEITFILAIVFCWKIEPIRTWLIILFSVHFAVRAWTIVYFAPHIMAFEKLAATGDDPAGLAARVGRWKKMNYIRVGIFIVISFGMLVPFRTIFS